ncbi:MAG: flagellar hook-associated protein FlgL, partial [Synergistaceae bacterium]|nr:flagellar hook-associated protein FlgL [Synergistaceae bacterium]
MSYRVTNKMMQTLLLNDMHNNLNKLLSVQQQMTTQRKYNSATENPNAVTKGMGLETMMTEGEQYRKNLQDAISWLKFSDSALGDMNNVFHRIRELAIYAGDGGLVDVDLNAVAEELRGIKEALRGFANSAIDGSYLFAGLDADSPPFNLGPNGEVVYAGNQYDIFWEFARQVTGKVSVHGREVFPLDEKDNKLKGIELPIDFKWQGRNEILEFKVGWRTVKVRIPERWEDEIRNASADSEDYNRFRDPGEQLEGYSLQEIADLINNSTEMGDVSGLLKATVVQDLDRGVQYLEIKSHTGEPVRLTSWQEEDAKQLAQGMMGAAYGKIKRVAGAPGEIKIRFLDGTIYTVDVEADAADPSNSDDLKKIADKLNSLPDGRIWAAYKTDGMNEWLDIVSRVPGEKMYLETTGGASALFVPGTTAAVSSLDSSGNETLTIEMVDAAATFPTGNIEIKIGSSVYNIPTVSGNTIAEVAGAINALTDSSGNPLFTTSIPGSELIIESISGEKFSVKATGTGAPPPPMPMLFSEGSSISSNPTPDSSGKYTLETNYVDKNFVADGDGWLSLEYGGNKYWIPVAAGEDLEKIKDNIENKLAVLSTHPVVTVGNTLDDDVEVSYLKIISDSPVTLTGYGSAAAVMGKYAIGSSEIVKNTDHTHIGFASFMGMETSMSSTELQMNTNWNTTGPGQAVDLKIVSGLRRAEIYIADDADLTIVELASRINGVCGDWLQAVVETDEPDGSDPFLDPLHNSGDNKEAATQRLVLRTIDGEPFAIYDGLGKTSDGAGSYASMLGIGTALTIPNVAVVYPDDGNDAYEFFDENIPATLGVTVGERYFEVKVCKNNRYTGELVAKAIVDQVNEQYGGKLLAWDENTPPSGMAGTGTFAVYALTGEPLRVVDKGYGDPRFGDYSGGVAIQLGIAAGITSNPHLEKLLIPSPPLITAGVMRVSTPGHTVDVPVIDGDTPLDIANRIRDYAGSWLDVSFVATGMVSDNTTPDKSDDVPTGDMRISIAAKDGSAVSMLDISGRNAQNMGLATGLTGDESVNLNTSFPTFTAGSTLTITINGASHTIDLYDSFSSSLGSIVTSAEDLVNLINTRFQGQDLRAGLIEDSANGKRMILWSPKGYKFELSAGVASDLAVLGFGGTNNVTAASVAFEPSVTGAVDLINNAPTFTLPSDELIITLDDGNVGTVDLSVLIPATAKDVVDAINTETSLAGTGILASLNSKGQLVIQSKDGTPFTVTGATNALSQLGIPDNSRSSTLPVESIITGTADLRSLTYPLAAGTLTIDDGVNTYNVVLVGIVDEQALIDAINIAAGATIHASLNSNGQLILRGKNGLPFTVTTAGSASDLGITSGTVSAVVEQGPFNQLTTTRTGT